MLEHAMTLEELIAHNGPIYFVWPVAAFYNWPKLFHVEDGIFKATVTPGAFMHGTSNFLCNECVERSLSYYPDLAKPMIPFGDHKSPFFNNYWFAYAHRLQQVP
jgi:hypothetical protein